MLFEKEKRGNEAVDESIGESGVLEKGERIRFW